MQQVLSQWQELVCVSVEFLQQQWKQIAAFANAESLTAHANSIEVRFEDETD